MNADPDQLLNRFVVAALTVFVTVSLLLVAFVCRELWLQQRITNLSTSLQVNLADLEATTEEIQNEISEMDTITNTAQKAENLSEVVELLTDANEQLDSIGEDVNTVATILDPEAADPPTTTAVTEVLPTVQDRADQVFTIFAILISIAGVVIAILLALAVRVQQSISSDRSPRT